MFTVLYILRFFSSVIWSWWCQSRDTRVTCSLISLLFFFLFFSDKFRCIKCKNCDFQIWENQMKHHQRLMYTANEWLKDLLSIPLLILQLILFDQNTVHLSWVCTRLSHVNKSSDRKAHDTYDVLYLPLKRSARARITVKQQCKKKAVDERQHTDTARFESCHFYFSRCRLEECFTESNKRR